MGGVREMREGPQSRAPSKDLRSSRRDGTVVHFGYGGSSRSPLGKFFAMRERIIPATYPLYRNEKPLAMRR